MRERAQVDLPQVNWAGPGHYGTSDIIRWKSCVISIQYKWEGTSRWEVRVSMKQIDEAAFKVSLQIRRVGCCEHVNCPPAEWTPQFSRKVPIANEKKAELCELIGAHSSLQVFWSAVRHLLRLDVHLICNGAAIVVHLPYSANSIGIGNLHRLRATLIGRRLHEEVVECCETRMWNHSENRVRPDSWWQPEFSCDHSKVFAL